MLDSPEFPSSSLRDCGGSKDSARSESLILAFLEDCLSQLFKYVINPQVCSLCLNC